MSWLFSQALVVDCLGENFSDGGPSAPLSGESTPLAYCAPDRMKGFSRLSRFGVTFKPLTDDLGADVLTLYLAAFPVKTSALPEKAQESTESVRECGATWLGSLGKYDPASRSWKTAQRSFLGDLEESLVTWPRSGMTAGGECWELPMLEPITSGTGSGLWPTPCADDRGTAKPSINQHWTKNGTLRHIGKDGRQSQVKLGEMVATGVKWPTPQASDNRNRGNADTPAIARRIAAGKQVMLTITVSGGQLNPTWVEWLMGWPLGWTDLKPSATDKSHSALPQHGECLEGQ